MTKPSWIQQVYGYAVCPVAIMRILISIVLFGTRWRWLGNYRDLSPSVALS